jgi:hypothetical protein
MRNFLSPWCLVAALLAVMAALMLGPVREESATMDEPVNLAAGYLYCTGYGYRFNPEHPPLGQILPALPLLFLDVNVPKFLEQLGDLQLGAPQARPWKGWESGKAERYYPGGRASWYYWPYWEAGIYGQELLYGDWNNPDILLWASRCVQVGLTLLTGLVIAFWLRREAAVFGVALWVFNPIALAYGHIVVTDISVTFGMTLAIWMFTMFLEKPSWRTALLAGGAMGLALVMKFSAVLLAPIFAVLLLAKWCETRMVWKWLPLVALAAWAVVMLVYAPYWKPAPALSAVEAARIGVPGWFQTLRPVLVPPGFFKGIAMQAEHAAFGHEAFLCGEWGAKGWWYYFPLALAWKLPVPLLVLTLAGLSLWLVRLRQWSFAEAAPWVAAFVFLALAMTSTINIGVRYVLPMLPLLAVGTAQQLSRSWRVAVWMLCAWLAVATTLAYPFYIEYFNEFAGGTRYGYRRLVDSNYDWGQDAKRLQAWLAERGNPKVYLRFFGSGKAIQHYGIRYEPASPDKMRQAKEGLLVISASALMKPDWRWLDEQRKPIARIGQTLFVYELRR